METYSKKIKKKHANIQFSPNDTQWAKFQEIGMKVSVGLTELCVPSPCVKYNGYFIRKSLFLYKQFNH